MRLSVKDFEAAVTAMPGTIRPVRVRLAGLTYCLDATEAITLATKLADVVGQLRSIERTES